jgi:O-antigen biosynthesis protein WbqP
VHCRISSRISVYAEGHGEDLHVPGLREDVLKRIFDIVFSLAGISLLAIPLLVVAVAVRLTSPGPALYWSERVGRYGRRFRMPKFRTMRQDTPSVATHLLSEPSSYVTPLGRILRKTSIDELPQLWSILTGDMSVVGPRPALSNQHDLIGLRSSAGVDELTPGLTGWAQINGRDELPITEKVRLDREYLERRCFLFDLRIILLTFLRVIEGQGVSH